MSLKALLSGQPTTVPYTLAGSGKTRVSDKFFSGVGVPVHSLRPSQNIPLLRLAFNIAGKSNIADDYEFLVHTAGAEFKNDFEMNVRRLLHKDAADVIFRDKPKSVVRMRDKEALDSGSASCASSHTDINAVMVFAKDIESFERLTERLRPLNNSHVAQLKEKAANPDETYFPGNTIKYVVEKNIGGIKVPIVTEIILLMNGCQKYYDQTHGSVEMKRGLSKFFMGDRKGREDPDVLNTAMTLFGSAGRDTLRINKKMTEKTGMDQIIQERSYYNVDGMPVTVVDTPKGDGFAFVPSAASGFYEIDNSYLQRVGASTRTSREEFLLSSQDIVPMPDIINLSGQSPETVQGAGNYRQPQPYIRLVS